MPLIAGTKNDGFPRVPMDNAIVLASINFSKLAGSSWLANFTLIPKLGNIVLNWLYVPPYKFALYTMLSPALQIVEMAKNCADCPLDTDNAATPPSKAAILFSKTSLVGFMILE